MPIDLTRIRQYIKEFNFNMLFVEELGWDRYSDTFQVSVDSQSFALLAIAEKRGMAVFLCSSYSNGQIPEYATRRKIEREVTKSIHEHLIIYTDAERTRQIWQWVKREAGKPTACREHIYHRNQPGDALIQKLQSIAFSLEEEENLTIPDVAIRARAAFDVERITKRFYDRFKEKHTVFLGFVNGITEKGDCEWYASVMLNRLMFTYFIQKKGFLDGDHDYLRNRLQMVQEREGKNKFFSFYRHFLMRLFHEGLGQREHTEELDALLGKVPYLNGGLFMPHPVEENYPDIQIPDEAFEDVFNFFDQYQWHLDERPLRADNEINPDVLGYIFEKYINQKQMGAYYTKEDITEYISKNTVLPFIFDNVQQNCKKAFEGEKSVWKLLQEEPDRYIYQAVKKGVELPLPPEIAAGLSDVSKRTGWNKLAPAEYGLNTEIWREVVARRGRYDEVKERLIAGEIKFINDFITYNLDIRQFAQDAIENSEDPDIIRAFYNAIKHITILDLTCGSGAFLFAALNILEPLYQACLDRMEAFITDVHDRPEQHCSEAFREFHKVLEEIKTHPNTRFFILKSIILYNLYGVDIMEEAVEICKLRFFLKLVAQVERVEDIEPLPDVDFNIRAGNTLVGFTKLEDVRKAIIKGQRKLTFEEDFAQINERAEEADIAFQNFCKIQTQQNVSTKELTDAKSNLKQQMKALDDELNRYLAIEYQIKNINFKGWLDSHKPFHWCVEFYSVFKNGGFDVIIGNPPYVEYTKVKKDYVVRDYQTENCGNLYAFVMERSFILLRSDGIFGMIVPLSSICTERTTNLQRIIKGHHTYLSHYSGDRNPAEMFDGVKMRLTICISRKNQKGIVWTSRYNKWFTNARSNLFPNLSFNETIDIPNFNTITKVGSTIEATILRKLQMSGSTVAPYLQSTQSGCYYHNAPIHWVRAFTFAPYFWSERDGEKISDHYKPISLDNNQHTRCFIAIMNSSLFYCWFVWTSNCRDLTAREIGNFYFDPSRLSQDFIVALEKCSDRLMKCYKSISLMINVNYTATGKVKYEQIDTKQCKAIIDEIDHILAKHYGFTEEELDFIINYDIKYRVGQEGVEE